MPLLDSLSPIVVALFETSANILHTVPDLALAITTALSMQRARPLVSYDDLEMPSEVPPQVSSAGAKPPPSKKRKSNSSASKVKQNSASKPTEIDEGRELKHGEIWDDSALIEAWDAATEEYEALNGPDKGWKFEPVHKSPLWYNTPKKYDDKKLNASSLLPTHPNFQINDSEQEDSKPLDFNTFTPTHNPALEFPQPPGGLADQGLYPTENNHAHSTFLVGQDEAFRRATNAIYWAGYWSAVYQCQKHYESRSGKQKPSQAAQEEEDADAECLEDNVVEDQSDEVMDDFVSTQR